MQASNNLTNRSIRSIPMESDTSDNVLCGLSRQIFELITAGKLTVTAATEMLEVFKQLLGMYLL